MTDKAQTARDTIANCLLMGRGMYRPEDWADAVLKRLAHEGFTVKAAQREWPMAIVPMLRDKANRGDGLAQDAADAIEDMRRMMWSCILELECLDAHTIPTQARNVLRQFFPQWLTDQETAENAKQS